MPNKKIKKAVIPVAGMGTRFLPASKAVPKEMLPVVDKPVIQYIAEEVITAGIEEVIFVTSASKKALEDHFDRNFELEHILERKNKTTELEIVKNISGQAKFAFVRQGNPLGDGHAVLQAVPFLGEEEPFAVLFGDDIITGKTPAIKEMVEVFEKFGKPVVALQKVDKKDTSKYGIIDGEKTEQKTWKINKFVEKPKPDEAPSDMAAVGRYVITPEIVALLKEQETGKDGEIRLADAFDDHLKKGGKMYGREFTGKRYDCGNKLQFLIAQIELGLAHPETGKELRKYLEKDGK